MLLSVLYVIAITAEAMTGALSAGRKNMDPVGVVFIACITAIGGGSVRDMLLGSYPLTWVAHPEYVVIMVATALIMMPVSQYMGKKVINLFIILDAAGLITFSIIGAQKTMELGHGYVIAAIMAVVTGVFGGVLRDILCNHIPLVFRQELYASVSLIATVLYFFLLTINLSHLTVVLITLATGFTLRMLAVRFKLELPKFRYKGSAC